MKNINEINRNLDAINQTRHVTNAMYMLSVTAMRKGLSDIEYNRKYMRYVCTAVKDILEKSPEIRHPYVCGNGYTGKRDSAFLVIASDKSLCGGYNVNIAGAVEEQCRKVRADGRESLLFTAGLKIGEILRARGYEVYKNYDGASQYPSMHHAYRIAHELIDVYLCGYVQDIYVIYTDYISAVEQPVVTHRLLPLAVENFDAFSLQHPYAGTMTYEPSVEAVYERMVPQYLQGYLYGCLCSALVCENMARMTAMQSATRNADEMLKKLSTAYNTARQLAITSELTEIAAATELINKAI